MRLAALTLPERMTSIWFSLSSRVPVAPAMWILNYLLVYALNPEKARFFPAYWEPIPEEVVTAIEESENGQVAYADFMDLFAR